MNRKGTILITDVVAAKTDTAFVFVVLFRPFPILDRANGHEFPEVYGGTSLMLCLKARLLNDG